MLLLAPGKKLVGGLGLGRSGVWGIEGCRTKSPVVRRIFHPTPQNKDPVTKT